MHPMKEAPPPGGGTMEYENSPQYPNDLSSIKSKITAIDPTANVEEEFLYMAQKEYSTPDEWWDTHASGKAIFEYVPNRSGRRYGRLLMEDGGVQTTDENRPPGLKEFDFGPAST